LWPIVVMGKSNVAKTRESVESDTSDEEMEMIENNNMLNKNENTKKVRMRQYPAGHEGPFVVNIRAVNVPLESKAIQKFIFEKYAHVKEITQVNEHKMRVVFANESGAKVVLVNGEEAAPSRSVQAREEANDLPRQERWNMKFRVYIPAKNVEVQGLIPFSKNQKVDDFPMYAYGKFRNPKLTTENPKVLEAVRLMRRCAEDATKMEETGYVIVTFEGLVLPDYVNVDGLLCPVKEFHNRKMFCVNCQRYNHTSKMCNNKKVDVPQEHANKCSHCNLEGHATGSKECPKRRQMEKKIVMVDRRIRKRTIAEMLQKLDPQGTMPNDTDNEVEYPPLVRGISRKRAAEQRRNERVNYADIVKSPPRKIRTTQSSSNPPPGFTNPNNEYKEITDGIVEFIQSLIAGMELPSFVTSLVETLVIPRIHKIISNMINSVCQKMNASWLAGSQN
jgi:hypothetical protein